MDTQLFNLQRKVDRYKEVVRNTEIYRQAWKEKLRDEIVNQLKNLIEEIGLDAKIETRGDMENLEAVVLSLGDVRSGLYQLVGKDIHRDFLKHNGSLIYQQLFNGKVIVLVNYPFIENYGEPRPPKTVGIYRPEELLAPYFVRHLEDLLQEVTTWEDYDDDEPTKRIGFNLNFGAKGEPALSGETDNK